MQITVKCPSSVKNSKCVHLVAQAVQHPHPPNLMWDAAGLPCVLWDCRVLCAPWSRGGAWGIVTQGSCCHTRQSLHRSVTLWMKRQCAFWWLSGNFGWLQPGVLKIRDQRYRSPLCPIFTCPWRSSQHWGTWCDAIELLNRIKNSTFLLSVIYIRLFRHRNCLWLFFIAVSENTDQDRFHPSRVEDFL